MHLIKKLLFIPLFLGSLAYFFYQVFQFIPKSLSIVFSLEMSSLITLILISGLALLASLLFVMVVGLAQDWRIITPTILIASLLPFIFNQSLTAQILAGGSFLSLLLIYGLLAYKLKKYIDFSPTALFSAPTKNLARLLLLVMTISYFFVIKTDVAQHGFQVPDQLIDVALQFAGGQAVPVKGTKYIAQIPSLTPEQIELLRQNPDAMRQAGFDPSILDSLPQSPAPSTSTSTSTPLKIPTTTSLTSPTSTTSLANPSNDLIKQILKGQIDKFMQPYLPFIPVILALLVFGSLYSFVSLVSILLPLVIWFIFLILEETKFLTFTTETREVKKLVV